MVTGPNSAPIDPVPRCCSANRPMSTAIVSGTTKWLSAGVAMEMPSMALSTEIAGVIIPSP